ncbi:MAG: hypothetical protein SGCHY_002530 [Lobulomycetales sp.]
MSLTKRVVFKSVIESPFTYKWSALEKKQEESLLRELVVFLNPLKEMKIHYNKTRAQDRLEARKLKANDASTKSSNSLPERAALDSESSRQGGSGGPIVSQNDDSEGISQKTQKDDSERPTISQNSTGDSHESTIEKMPQEAHESTIGKMRQEAHDVKESLVVGANMITKTLQNAIDDVNSVAPLDLILVCRADVENYQLYSHIPTMACLTTSDEHPVYLCALEKGSEKLLADALGLRRVTAIGFKHDSPPVANLLKLVKDSGLAPVNLPWLQTARNDAILVPPAVKSLQTFDSLLKGKKRKRNPQ